MKFGLARTLTQCSSHRYVQVVFWSVIGLSAANADDCVGYTATPQGLLNRSRNL